MKRPPYARQVAEALRRPDTWPQYVGTSADGRAVTIWVCFGPAAWDIAAEKYQAEGARRLLLVAPPDQDPAALDWGLCAGRDPVLLLPCGPIGDETRQALVAALLRDGVERVLAMDTARRYLREGTSDAG